jgi:hypothetical protein
MGLMIDENFYLHYRQLRRDQTGKVLIDKLAPWAYKDYVRGAGLLDPMIDESRNDGIDNDNDWNAEFDDVGVDGVEVPTNDRGESDGMPTAGEPNFDQTDVDESDQIGLTSFEYFTTANEFSMAMMRSSGKEWRGLFQSPASIVNNKPERGEDGDFIYGSGYFPCAPAKPALFPGPGLQAKAAAPRLTRFDLA